LNLIALFLSVEALLYRETQRFLLRHQKTPMS